MNRPKIKDFFSEDATVGNIQFAFSSEPELYNYIQALDTYIDELEKPETERDMWKMLDQINVIMWESYMIKDRPFGRDEGRKIMEVLEQWAERH